jgi:hypothetical protein
MRNRLGQNECSSTRFRLTPGAVFQIYEGFPYTGSLRTGSHLSVYLNLSYAPFYMQKKILK